MEKPTWRKIQKNTSKPCPRWGHACCVIQDEVVFFGGYADSNYMNDIWIYHATEKSWQEVATTGQRPAHRSNCTLTYDQLKHQVIVFGGGGPNKQRFNSISILDWQTKVWREITPHQNQAAPWERTYHVAELTYPYLVVFGGEGLADLDDLWIFDFTTERWTEAKINKESPRPCARRFHSSCMIGRQFFVVAGCHGKYRCLSDVYSLDLSPLFETGKVDQLQWVQRKLKGASFLSRWGHSSVVFDGKIYVFAGRFSSDLNDILVIDINTNSLKGLKMGGSPSEYPKPRRRHCAGFVGSCMIIFGGFNGEYFNDLNYINVFELTSRVQNQEEGFMKLVGSQELADENVFTSDGESVPVHLGLLGRWFQSEERMREFLEAAQNRYSKDELLKALEMLYRGYGKVQDELLLEYQVILPQKLNRRWQLNQLLQSEANERNILALAHKANEKTTEMVVLLKEEEFQTFISMRRRNWNLDGYLVVGKSKIRVNRQQLSALSPYFKYLFMRGKEEVSLPVQGVSGIVVEMLLGGLMMGVLAVPVEYSLQGWMELTRLCQYFCLEGLRSVCQSQLSTRVTQHNSHALEVFAQEMDMNTLAMHCASHILRQQLSGEARESKGAEKLKMMLRLQLSHQSTTPELFSLKKTVSECPPSGPQQKQNNRELSNF